MDNIVQKKKPSFFLIIAIVGLFAVLIGFAKTFIIPVATNSFSAPLLIHIHGAFAFAWILLFLTQTSLIHFDKYKIHQTLLDKTDRKVNQADLHHCHIFF